MALTPLVDNEALLNDFWNAESQRLLIPLCCMQQDQAAIPEREGASKVFGMAADRTTIIIINSDGIAFTMQ